MQHRLDEEDFKRRQGVKQKVFELVQRKKNQVWMVYGARKDMQRQEYRAAVENLFVIEE